MPTVHLKLEEIGGQGGAKAPPLSGMSFIMDLLNDGKSLFPTRAWVAKITGKDAKYGFARDFLKPIVDYSQANSEGTRGVYKHYYLNPGSVYEISEPLSWKRTDRYFCTFTSAENIVRLAKEDVPEWLEKDHSLLPF